MKKKKNIPNFSSFNLNDSMKKKIYTTLIAQRKEQYQYGMVANEKALEIRRSGILILDPPILVSEQHKMASRTDD